MKKLTIIGEQAEELGCDENSADEENALDQGVTLDDENFF
jgi:hypothetical protein